MPARLALLGLILLFSGLPLAAQEAATSGEDGFVSIFDGTLKGWEGDPVYWKAEGGIMVGEVTPATLLKQNTFLIWRGGELADFELKLEYRVSALGNSGINYRSSELPEVKWGMRGYQDDIDGKNEYTGQNYEERGRQFLAYRGQSTRVTAGKTPEVVSQLGDRAELMKLIHRDDWNQVWLVAKGNLLRHYLNGVLMSEVRDEDPEKRADDRSARGAGSRRPADEDRVPQHPGEAPRLTACRGQAPRVPHLTRSFPPPRRPPSGRGG